MSKLRQHLLWLLLLLLSALLGACSTAPIALPLAEDMPTFLFYYTDN